ncbi:MAG TPA: aldehyde dehydrogenase family protein [Bryobacteraceae bacterium]|nr:aldehyde dehydrogenase family protein [Bryobacteraceae bacterium]
MTVNQELVQAIAREVVARIEERYSAPSSGAAPAGDDGVFETVDLAVKAAVAAQRRVAAMGMEDRERMNTIIRRICHDNAEELARVELAETKIGRADHKAVKLRNIRFVLGADAMRTDASSDSSGLCLVEHAPWGVIGMVLPATHSVPTMASNAINILAAGNTAVFSPHPSGAKVAARAMQMFNREIQRELGAANVLTMAREATIQNAERIFQHPDVALICATGGPAVVKAAMKFGKRVIAAGPGNPPVVVDETADLDAAAKAIIQGASFDNNLLCIGEKEAFVVASVADAFLDAMRRAGAFQLDARAIEALTNAAFTFTDEKGARQPHVKRDLIGKDVAVLAEAAGVRVPAGADLLFGETAEDHPFVQEEQMMPFLPVVRVRDVDAAIQASVRAEHGYRHTAVIHSRNLDNATRMARAMNATLFVQNGPCFASLNAPSYLSHSIATPTGEGVTTPMTFTRQRRIVIGGGALRIL